MLSGRMAPRLVRPLPPPSSSSSSRIASSSSFLSSITTFSLTLMNCPVLTVDCEVIVSSEKEPLSAKLEGEARACEGGGVRAEPRTLAGMGGATSTLLALRLVAVAVAW